VPGKWTVPTVLRSFAARVPTRHPRLRRMSRRCWRRATWTRELRVSPSQCETAASDCAGGGDRTEPCARTSGEPYLCRTIALDHDLLSHHPVSCLRSPAGLSFPRRLGSRENTAVARYPGVPVSRLAAPRPKTGMAPQSPVADHAPGQHPDTRVSLTPSAFRSGRRPFVSRVRGQAHPLPR